jgi:hypothetical protein
MALLASEFGAFKEMTLASLLARLGGTRKPKPGGRGTRVASA